MTCTFLAILAGLLVWLRVEDLLAALLTAGGAFFVIVPVAFQVVRSLRRR